jgi:toxin ParE1/3/4
LLDGARSVADVEFSNAAIADLSEIDEYSVAVFGDEVGEAYMRDFDTAFARLSEYPFIGPAAPEYGKPYRCLVQGSHRIFYVVQAELVLIVRIIHHARNARRELNG